MKFDRMFVFEIIQQMNIVSDEKHGISSDVWLDERISDSLGAFPIQISCRFISDDKFWVVDECSSKTYFLFFSSAESFHFFICDSFKVKFFNDCVDFTFYDRFTKFVNLQWIRNIFYHRQFIQELIILENNSDFFSQILNIFNRVIWNIFTFVKYGISRWSLLSCDEMDEGRFPSPWFSCKDTKISMIQFKIKIFKKFFSIFWISSSQVCDLDEWLIVHKLWWRNKWGAKFRKVRMVQSF